MKILSLTLVLAAALAGVSAVAQDTSAPQAAASMPMMDCAQPMAPHDHGAERNAHRAMPKAMPCGETTTVKKAPKRPLHDHNQFHKNQ